MSDEPQDGAMRIKYDPERHRIVKEEYQGHPDCYWTYVDAFPLEAASLSDLKPATDGD